MSELTQILNDKATVYTLTGGSAWKETGPSGQLMVYHYRTRPDDILVRWWKKDTSLAYQVSPGHLKARGASAWVVRAYNMNCQPPVEEIIAIRFQHEASASKFKAHFETVSTRVIEEKKRRRLVDSRKRMAVDSAEMDPYAVAGLGSPRAVERAVSHPVPALGRYSGSSGSASVGASACEVPEVDEKWVCERCKNLTPLREIMCSRCYNPVPERPKVVRSVHTSLPTEVLGSLPSPRPIAGPPAVDWHCPVCTYKNGGCDSRCRICGSGNPAMGHLDDDGYEDEDDSGSSPTAGGPTRGGGADDSGSDDYDIVARMMREQRRTLADRERIRIEMAAEMAERLETEKELDADFARRLEEQELAKEEERRQAEAASRRLAMQLSGGSGSLADDSASDRESAADDRGPGHWSCAICTLDNPPSVMQCQACESLKSMADPLAGFSDDRGAGGGHRGRCDSTHSATSLFESFDDLKPSETGSKLVRDYEAMRSLPGYKGTKGMREMHDPYGTGGGGVTRADFYNIASEISSFNDTPTAVFGTLKGVAKKLLRDDFRYRSLDTTNPKVEERLIGYEGVLDFLYLMGFEGDALGQKLTCRLKPPETLVRDALDVLDEFEKKGKGFDGMVKAAALARPKPRPPPRVECDISAADAGIAEEEMDDDFRQALAASMEATLPLDFDVSDVDEEDGDPGDVMTVRQIILWCTHEKCRDYDTMETLFMSHTEFTSSIILMKELRKRFFVQIPPDCSGPAAVEKYGNNVMKPIQLNVIKCLRHWMKEYWAKDFEGNEELEEQLREWVKKMEAKVKVHNWNGVLAQYVRADLKKYRKYGSRRREPPRDYSSVEIPKKFSIYKLSKNELADQITLLDYRVFGRIHPRECLGQAWKKKDRATKSENILKMIAQFNNLTKFVQIQILREKSLSARGKALKRIIKMAGRFHKSRNYNSLCAVYAALNSAPIHRLKLAWEKVQPREKKLLDEYKAIFSRDYNHRMLRQIFREAVGSPCIPHIGIFLQDLVFIDDSGEDEKKIDNLGDRMMANFSKHMRLAERIKKITEFQRCPFTKLKDYPAVQKLLLEEFEKLKEITEDIIWDMSTEVKKQDERDKTRFF